MGMFDLFTAKPDTPPAAPAGEPTPPGAIPPPTVTGEPGQGTVPNLLPDSPAAGTVPDSPLAPYEKLWEDVPTDPNNPAPQATPPLEAGDVQKAVDKANFAPTVTPEQMQAITGGGEEAQAAFMGALNEVARKVMVQSTMVNNKLTEKAVQEALARQATELPGMLREQAVSDHLATTNPLFQNPAVAPVVEATKAQLLQKFPNATHAEITEMTQNYIIAMGESFAPQTVDSAEAGEDWAKFLQG